MKPKIVLTAACLLAGLCALLPLKPSLADAHDIALTSLSVSANQTYEGLGVRVEVAVRNQGAVPETFNVTFCVNGTSGLVNVDTYLVGNLGASSEIVIPFVWHTGGATPGVYTVLANASVVAGELSTANNFIVGDAVAVLADETSPVIDVPRQDPEGYVEEWVMVHVYVNVSDAESGVSSVIFSWRVNNESHWEYRTMAYDPIHGYSYAIGSYPGGTVVSYRINATDNAGNQAIRDHAGLYYAYTVIPEVPSTTVLFVSLFCTLATALVLTTRHSL